MTIFGSVSATGVTLTDPTIISNIVLALRTSTAYGLVTFGAQSNVKVLKTRAFARNSKKLACAREKFAK